jgi:hypothetical protein
MTDDQGVRDWASAMGRGHAQIPYLLAVFMELCEKV